MNLSLYSYDYECYAYKKGSLCCCCLDNKTANFRSAAEPVR